MNINTDAKTRLAAMATISILIIVGSLPTASAQEPVELGSADPFAILAGSTVTNTGPSNITGDIGLHPGTSVTGFPPGTVNGEIHVANETARQAKENLTTAYNDAAGRSSTSLGAELGGRNLTAGVYRSEEPGFGLTGTLTLNAEGNQSAVWIFQMASTLITATDSSVVLINGAQACNVFWQVGSSATLGTDTDFVGTIMAQESIGLDARASLEGRALARTAAVTLDTNVITAPECAEEPPGEEPLGEEPPGEEPPGEEPPGEEPPGEDAPGSCSTDLKATVNEDTSINLTWKPVEGADQHRIYRAEGDGDFILHEELDGDASKFLDTDTEAGVTYRYELVPAVSGVESEDCEVVEATAIPVLPGLLAGPLALVGGIAAYACSRRRT